MKNNILVLILVLGILVLGFLYMKEKGSDNNLSENESTSENNNTNETDSDDDSETNNNSTPLEEHEYTDSTHGFYMDLDGRVVTDKNAVGFGHHITYFDKSNGQRDAMVESFTNAQWQQYWNSLSTTYNYVGVVEENGLTFKYYTKSAVDPGPNDPQTLHYYIIQQNGLYYQIMVTNPNLLSSFGFL